MTSLYPTSSSSFDRASAGELTPSRNGSEGISLPDKPNIGEFLDAFTQLKRELESQALADRGKIPEQLLRIQKFGLVVEKYSLSVQQAFNSRSSEPESPSISDRLRALRQNWRDIVTDLNRASTEEDLLNLTATQLRLTLQADRVSIYRFGTPAKTSSLLESGEWGTRAVPDAVSIAESLGRGWTPTFGETLPILFLGIDRLEEYLERDAIAINEIEGSNPTPYQRQLLDRYQVRASLSVPILMGDRLWGAICIHQCRQPRQWQETEIALLERASTHLSIKLQSYDFNDRLQQKAQTDRTIAKIIERIRQSLDLDTIFRSTVREVRRALNADRVGVYRFDISSGYQDGEYIADDSGAGYPSVVGMKMHDTCFADDYVADYTQGRIQVIDDVREAELTNCHLELLERFDIRANLIVPLIKNGQLWGMLAVHQCSRPRQWQPEEIEFARRIAEQFSVALQQAEALDRVRQQSDKVAEVAERDRAVSAIVERILKTSDIQIAFESVSRELRRLLGADRVGVFQFYPDSGYDDGEFVAEDVASSYPSAVAAKIHDHCFGEQFADKYVEGRIQAVADIYDAELSDCHIKVLSDFNVRANLIVPMLKGKNLWGLLCVHQCSGPRHWHSEEIEIVKQIAAQLTSALQQVEYVEQLQAKSEQLQAKAERDRTIFAIIDRIRQSLDLDNLFSVTVREVRRSIEADRVGVFQFYPDAGYDDGEFVAEDVAAGYPSAVAAKIHDHCFGEQFADKYVEGRIQAVADIYDAGLSECHIKVLSDFDVRANLIVPLLKGTELWGLLCVHQCRGPRHWQESEIEFIQQIAAQFTVALQQAEYLQQLKTQSEQLTQAAERAKAAQATLQQRAVQLLMAVRPALDGDLTVRAPITEDEIGTLADMYNNTIQSLRKIVIQVQSSAGKVVETSDSSDSSLMQLAGAAQTQAVEIDRALNQIQEMLNFNQSTATNAHEVESAIDRANQTLDAGDKAMNRTVEGIMAIRKTVGEAAKRIKRLNKSSESIAKVVSLINNFATQTRLLAMNASIEATRAGEYGRGFAVVADEVRSLAQQSSDATTEIEKLVQEIQMETRAVKGAMEVANQRVAAGTNLMGETWQTLNDMVEATGTISELVQGITQATHQQTEQAQSVTELMRELAAISRTTSDSSMEISASFKEALNAARELQVSAERFKVDRE
ncbi:MAG: GAF domain-containing protein [Cyanobacteriota bacterium]|nr:GAF domain-containing protein [Cyanobacteriota bacterium]